MSSPASYQGPVPPGLLSPPMTPERTVKTERKGRSLHEEATVLRPAAVDPEVEGAFARTYEEFLETKRQCGEPVEGITFEKFAAKLRQSREQIMKQHKCRTVRFQVYVKEGRAALKATPVTR